MTGIENVDSLAVCTRVIQVFFGSFIYIFLVAKQVGPENKKLWFRKRKKYTFFNRRGIFGEDINFGYPVTWQGILSMWKKVARLLPKATPAKTPVTGKP